MATNILLAVLSSLVFQTGVNAQAQTLPSGCTADNAVRAIQNHSPGAYQYCSQWAPSVTYRTLYNYRYTYTITGGTTTKTIAPDYRYTVFTNAHSIDTYSQTLSPLTYSNNIPSILTDAGFPDPTPTYLSYPFPRITSACDCVVTPTSTVYVSVNDYSTSYVRPKSTYTSYTSGSQLYGSIKPTYGQLCNPSIYARFNALRVTISATRAVKTISPVPTVGERAECCQLCANTYNCLYWKHSKNGACEYVWATDVQTPVRYQACPNGYNDGSLVFGAPASVNASTVYAAGTCGLPDSSEGENQSSDQSTEAENPYKSPSDLCVIYGGSYCSA